MIVRELEKQERKNALDIIWSVFCMDVAEVYEQEGIDTFREYLKQENIEIILPSLIQEAGKIKKCALAV